MLEWLKTWRDHKRARLIMENHAALRGPVIRSYLESVGDKAATDRLGEIGSENARIADLAQATGVIASEDVDMLLDMNAELRILHEEASKALKKEKGDIESFDEAYEPKPGWEHYFEVPSGIS